VDRLSLATRRPQTTTKERTVMTDQSTCADAEFIRSIEGFELFPVLVRLLAQGRPVGLDELAAAACRPASAVKALLCAQPGAEWGDDGSLVGCGLSLRPTEFRYTVARRTLYTWCAADTLLFTVILEEPAEAKARCPATGQLIRVKVAPDAVVSVDPPDAVVSERQPAEQVCDLRKEICGHGHFFASLGAASGWLEAHPDGRVLSVTEAFESARTTCQTLGWLPTGTHRR
jgi:alkylmercury lyase